MYVVDVIDIDIIDIVENYINMPLLMPLCQIIEVPDLLHELLREKIIV